MTAHQPTVRYEIVYDDEFDVYDVYVDNGSRVTGQGGFDTHAEAMAWIETHRNAQP